LSTVLDEHRQYLSDIARLTAFERAIKELVRPGDVVVDLGAGTGILGLLACRAGAAHVYSLENTSLIGVTREMAHTNHCTDRITFIKEHSLTANLPERADVVVGDQIGRFGFEAGVFEYFADARHRFLKPGGITVPNRIDLIAAPVEADEMWACLDFWHTIPMGFDVSPGWKIARNTGYPVKYEPGNLLGPPAALASLDPGMKAPTPVRGQVDMTLHRHGTLHGLGGWFSAHLSPSAIMSNSPVSSERINRSNVFFPVEQPVRVVPGDRVDLTMEIGIHDVMVRWEATVRDASGNLKASSRHSTFEGMLLCQEDLARTRPDFVPTLTPRGQARLTVLSLCDGNHRLDDVEREVYRRHPELFETLGHASQFVAEVVSRYTT
jgi:protein arginine N-methyltransferase 1